MDTVAAKLARLALGLKFEDLSDEVLHKAKQMLLDTLGCALGGYLSEPSKITRSVVGAWGGTPESTIIGVGARVPCTNAALANGVMVRYLDYNDIYTGPFNGGHPSETIPTALAVGEKQHVTGRDLITVVVLGFELGMRFGDAFSPQRVFDHTQYGAFCSPLIAGRLIGLTEEQMINAVGISGSHNLALGKAIRTTGQITMMKAMGYAFAAQSGITAALLAKEGLTGQGNVIELFIELFNEVSEGDAVRLDRLTEGDEKLKILKTGIKPYASEFMIHSPIEALFKLLKEHPLQPDDIEEIHVKIYKRAFLGVARPERWQPQTRESADHSLPYCLAIALLEGDVSPDQFAREKWKNPKVLELMARIKCSEDPELTRSFHTIVPAVLEIRTKKGDIYTSRVDVNRGHPKNPMTDEELQAKFRRLASKLMAERQIRQVIDAVYNIEAESDACNLMQLLVV